MRPGTLFLLLMLIPGDVLSRSAPARPKEPIHAAANRKPGCRKISFAGDANAGKEWSVPIGQGWLFRLIPIAPSGRNYTGWDLVVSPPGDTAYPDALLLGTPPYGSLTQREIGTTFGLRAQDAIVWQPRHFHFLLSINDLIRARALFRQISDPRHTSPAAATGELLQLVTSQPGSGRPPRPFLGTGTLSILDAKYVSGSGDPVPYAQQWARQLGNVPHTIVETGQPVTSRGELLSIRFNAVLWLPETWRLPAPLPPDTTLEAATCAE